MAAPVPIIVVDRPQSLVARSGFLLLHTIAVYLCALFFSPRLVAAWFNWITPFLHIESSASPADWYLQHLPIVTIIPALIVGYLNARGSDSVGSWAWAVPTLILAFKFVTYDSPGSVLSGSQLSAFHYFFDVQHVMPTFANPLASDPGRVLAQMDITDPFYAGVSYSLGALVSKRRILKVLFAFGSVANRGDAN